MSFANPADAAADNAERYIQGLLDTLGDRDPLAVLAEQPARLTGAVDGLDDAALRLPERAGKWSVAEVVGHLADSELVSRYRLRRIVAQPGAPIEAYDQDAWARELDYARADASENLLLIRTLREATVRWLRGLTPEQWRRGGVHAERGLETVDRLVRLMAGHDLVHLAQIARVRAAIGR